MFGNNILNLNFDQTKTYTILTVVPLLTTGVRRLRKKVGNALKEYTYRKRGSGRNNRK